MTSPRLVEYATEAAYAAGQRSLVETLTYAVQRIAALIEDEVRLRGEARRLELDPDRSEEAARAFAEASRLRAERMELMERCGLIV